ncbi:hypothetical protein FAF44_50475 [Nonomuraea sp. MG754425]|uniref:hypothetical protein n=1 Tax=Nonomuraea sp. MG754425 TaxID=2570319 RepID=UPI001F367037|nr:hypothetical protein [Nonomuraea sp. MG754425]MCF6476507.1 hypothetical protein [Nonomuraea sp. MG754425]
MSDRFEERLASTLTVAGHLAPQPAGDLVAQLAVRRRRTRRRVRVTLAVAASVMIAGSAATALTFQGGFAEDTSVVAVQPIPNDDPSGPIPPDLSTMPPAAADVWPEAVTIIPAAAADGWRYRPVTALSATEVLLTAESSFEKAGRLEVYDTDKRNTTVLGSMPEPENVKGYYAQEVEAGPGHIAWYGQTPNNDRNWADLWVMPRDGGRATQVAVLTGDVARIERIGVTADHIVWSVRSGGAYRVPIAGGAPKKIAGSDGFKLYSWPWATGRANLMVNLETGEQRSPQGLSGLDDVTCSPEWCVGSLGQQHVVQRFDGTGRRTVPDDVRMTSSDISGRFLVSGFQIFDMSNGHAARVGAVGPQGISGARGISSTPTSIWYWRAGKIDYRRICPDAEGDSPSRTCKMTEVGKATEYDLLNLDAVAPFE